MSIKPRTDDYGKREAKFNNTVIVFTYCALSKYAKSRENNFNFGKVNVH